MNVWRRLRVLSARVCLLALGMAQATAFVHLATHERPHVHTTDGATVYLDQEKPPVDDVRALFAHVEARGQKQKTPSRHEASGLAHFAVPLVAAVTLLFLPTTDPVGRVSSPANLPAVLERVPSAFDARGPPAA